MTSLSENVEGTDYQGLLAGWLADVTDHRDVPLVPEGTVADNTSNINMSIAVGNSWYQNPPSKS